MSPAASGRFCTPSPPTSSEIHRSWTMTVIDGNPLEGNLSPRQMTALANRCGTYPTMGRHRSTTWDSRGN
jgi:hypothetical protein